MILFGNEKYPAVHPKFYPNQRFGEFLEKVPAHSPTLKVGFAAEAILQVAVRNVLQRNIIVSFPLQSDIKLLSAVLCEISVTIFIFAKRYFPISARDYRLLQKVA